MFLSVCGNRFWRFGEWGGRKGRKGGAGEKKAGGGRGEAGGAWFFVQASGNGFSKYSGKMVPAGRNRPRFAIRAHCGLLVTSVSPNCCFFERNIKKISFPCAKQLRKYASPASPPDGLLPLFSLFPISSRPLPNWTILISAAAGRAGIDFSFGMRYGY